MALYVQVKPAEVQFLQDGRVPSPMHLTFLLWQASQALFTAAAFTDSAMLLGIGASPGKMAAIIGGSELINMSVTCRYVLQSKVPQAQATRQVYSLAPPLASINRPLEG